MEWLGRHPAFETLLPGLGVALAIGLLVGVERGWHLRAERLATAWRESGLSRCSGYWAD